MFVMGAICVGNAFARTRRRHPGQPAPGRD